MESPRKPQKPTCVCGVCVCGVEGKMLKATDDE